MALDVGVHTFNVPSADNLGNRAVQSIAFGAIDANLTKSLLTTLDAAAQTRQRGDCATAANLHGAFVLDLQAQTGKGGTAQLPRP